MAIVVDEMLVVVKIIKLIRICWQLVVIKLGLYPVAVLLGGLAMVTHIYTGAKFGSSDNTANIFLVTRCESLPRHRTSCKVFRGFTLSCAINTGTVPQTGTRRHPSTAHCYGKAAASTIV
jgi:hypothetical protein